MRVHKNARTTPQSRALLIHRIRQGQSARGIAQALGISVRTVRKWVARERAEGAGGLQDRSTRHLGHRVTGDRHRRSEGVGWDFLHVCIDDASRLAYVQIHPDEGKYTATRFLFSALRFLRDHGVRVQRVMTDNGSAYRSLHFAKACRRLGLAHKRTRPYTPRTNGKAERFIQTLLRRWAYQCAYPNSQQRNAALPQWLHAYNHLRPHASLGRKPPISRLCA